MPRLYGRIVIPVEVPGELAAAGDSPAIDEAAGRLEVSRRGIPNTGTLGVLRAAAIEGLVP